MTFLLQREAKILKAEAWVDGTFSSRSGNTRYGAGVVLKLEGIVAPLEQCSAGEDKRLLRLKSSGGEIAAAMLALETCLKLGVTDLLIYYDYAGIEFWATGIWPPSNSAARLYVKLLNQAKVQMSISFVKVAAHSGEKFNERADWLAKRSVRDE